MRTIAGIILGAILCSASISRAGNDVPAEAWFEKANGFYNQQQFDSALIYYEKTLQAGAVNAGVLYNLGNACYRLKKIGLAILNFEKARRLSPKDPDINANIKFANANITDKITAPDQSFFEVILWQLHTLFPLNTQLWLLFFLLMLLAALFTLGLFSAHNTRLWIIYGGTITLLLIAGLGISVGYKVFQSENVSYAIVLSESVDAKNQPRGPKIIFTAHEGTKFRIHQQIEGWCQVSLPNGTMGWVEESALGKI